MLNNEPKPHPLDPFLQAWDKLDKHEIDRLKRESLRTGKAIDFDGKEFRLVEIVGGFQKWLEMCRTVSKGQTENSNVVRLPKRVTQKGETKVANMISVMKDNQACDVAEQATAKAGAIHAPAIVQKAIESLVHAGGQWECRLFQQAEDILYQIEEKTANPKYKELAKALSDDIGALLTEVSEEMKAAAKLMAEAKRDTETKQEFQTEGKTQEQQVAAG